MLKAGFRSVRSSSCCNASTELKSSSKRSKAIIFFSYLIPAAMATPRETSLVDLDLDRLGLGALVDRQFEYRISVGRADAVSARVERKPESASEMTVAPLCDMNRRLLRPLGPLALRGNTQLIVLHLDVERLTLEPRHL